MKPESELSDIERQILAECRAIASETMYNYDKPETLRDVITSEEREVVAQEYFRAALQEIEYAHHHEDPPGTPELVLRAIRYLAGHAMPPIRDNTAWFYESLRTLILIALPHTASPKGGEPFFVDLRRGMDCADEWSRQHHSPET